MARTILKYQDNHTCAKVFIFLPTQTLLQTVVFLQVSITDEETKGILE